MSQAIQEILTQIETPATVATPPDDPHGIDRQAVESVLGKRLPPLGFMN